MRICMRDEDMVEWTSLHRGPKVWTRGALEVTLRGGQENSTQTP